MSMSIDTAPTAPAIDALATRTLLVIRDQKVMIDAYLAELYGVPTNALIHVVKRKSERFPADFMFQLTTEDKQEVVTKCDHLAKLKFSK